MPSKQSTERYIYPCTYRERVNNNPWNTVATFNSLDRTLVSTFNGVNNPSWWLQVRYGQNATTDASGTRSRLIVTPYQGFLSYGTPGNITDVSEEGCVHAGLVTEAPTLASFPGLYDSVRNAVLVKFLLRCKSEQRKLQGQVVLGELRKTIQLIRNPLKAFESATRAYAEAVRGRSRGLSPRLIPKMLASEYLSYTYGVIPILHDIKGAYEACIRLRDLPNLVKVRAVHVEERQASSSASNASFYSVSHHREAVDYIRVTSKIVGAVKVQSVGPVPPLMEVSGFTLRDFIPSVYELIPYSFLVDYVTNVGDVLNALSFAQADLAWHSWSTVTSAYNRVSLSPRKPTSFLGQPILGYSFIPCIAELSRKDYSRSGAPLGLPSLAFKLPSYGAKVNTAFLLASKIL